VHSNVRYFRTTRTVKTKYDHAKQCQIPKNHSKNNNKDDLCINVCIPKLKCSSLFVLLVRLHNTSIPCVPQRCNQPHLMEAPISQLMMCASAQAKSAHVKDLHACTGRITNIMICETSDTRRRAQKNADLATCCHARQSRRL